MYRVHHIYVQIMTKVVHLKVHVIICTKSRARKSGDVAREAGSYNDYMEGWREVVQSKKLKKNAKKTQKS